MTTMEWVTTPRPMLELPPTREAEMTATRSIEVENDAIQRERLLAALDPTIKAVFDKAAQTLRETHQALDDTRLALAAHEAVVPLRSAERRAWDKERDSLSAAIVGYERALERAQRAHADAYTELLAHARSVAREHLKDAEIDRAADRQEYDRRMREVKAFGRESAERRDMVARMLSRLVGDRDADPLKLLNAPSGR